MQWPLVFKIRNGIQGTIQPVQIEDAEVYLNYLKATIPDAWRNLNTPKNMYKNMKLESFIERMGPMLSDQNTAILAMKIDQEIVGISRIRRNERETQLHCGSLGMTVHPNYRGLSIGNLLLGAVILYAREKYGIWNVFLHVRIFNRPAIRLYEKHGFKRIGRLENAVSLAGELNDEYYYQLDTRSYGNHLLQDTATDYFSQ